MRRHRAVLAVLAVATSTFAIAATAASASATTGAVAHRGLAHRGLAHRGLPHQVFAPYFETYDTTDGGLAALSQASGAKFLSLAFLQTAQAGSCTAYWDGNTATPIAASSFGSDIAAIQRAGGNVIPSFGGFTADTTGTELADSCTDVHAIAAVFESLITTYHVSRIDLDIEATSLSNTDGINRRNEAIAETERWARAHGHRVQFAYTLPTFPTGLTSDGVAVLQNAIADHARIAVVNLLTFDYFFGTQQDMVADTETAAEGLFSQLQSLYPSSSAAHLWHMIGVTEMPGIDDFGAAETLSEADASAVLTWARQHRLGFLSFWALQRDNGNCPGTKGAGNCSGLDQQTWFFSHLFERFTR
ncbi:MAG TPA: chitinase [Streptosporangiaceae bacterium]|nr:chitinase [Streptosporangiaceae bacterium]